MRKNLIWLLLLLCPFIVNPTHAQGSFESIQIENPFGDDPAQITVEFQGFDPEEITPENEGDLRSILTKLDVSAVDSSAGEIRTVTKAAPNTSIDAQKLMAVNSAIGVASSTYKLTLPENPWVPDNFPVSTQMRSKAVDAQNLVINFERVEQRTIYTETGSQLDEDPRTFQYHAIKKPYEFSKSDMIRATTNIQGISFVGPVVFSMGADAKITAHKKMRAAYALLGKIIASKMFLVKGEWDGRISLQLPDSSTLFSRRSGDASESGTFLGQETDLIDYTGTNEEGTIQIRTIMEKLVDFMKRIMIPIAVVLVAYSGVSLYLSFQNEEKMTEKIRQLTGILVGFLVMMLAVNAVDWVIFGSEGQILRGEVDVADFARRGFEEVSGLFDFFTGFAVIIAVAFIVFNSITLMLAGGEDEGQISAIKKRILYALIGIVLMISARPLLEVFTADGQLVMPEVRGTISIVAKWLNFILGFIGVLAVVAIIYGGIQMIAHFGDESQVESAKNIIKAAAIGLVLAFSSWVVVYYFVFAGQV